jgi:hypothetical protein
VTVLAAAFSARGLNAGASGLNFMPPDPKLRLRDCDRRPPFELVASSLFDPIDPV